MLCCLIVITLSSLAIYCPLYLIEIIIKCLEKDDKKEWSLHCRAAAGPWMSASSFLWRRWRQIMSIHPLNFLTIILSSSRLLSLRCSLSNALRSMLLRIMIMMKRSSSILMRSHWTPRIVCTFQQEVSSYMTLSIFIMPSHSSISQCD